MRPRTTLAASACAILALAGPVLAQDQAAFQLPAQCAGTVASDAVASDAQEPAMEHGADHAMTQGGEAGMGEADAGEMAGHDMGHGEADGDMMPAPDMAHDMGHGEGEEGAMPEHVRQNMAKMLVTMPAMQQGMMQADADIAFACGMIAHHQAAIDMAQVVLDHGQDAQLRRLAEEIVDLQTAEIEVMTEWLETSAR